MGWGCVHTYTSDEAKAVRNLGDQSYEAFCPMRQKPNPKKLTEFLSHPLFPGYVFVLIEPGRRWASINSTPGVIRLLTDRVARPREGWSAEAPPTLNPIWVGDHLIEGLRGTAVEALKPDTVVRVRWRDNPWYGIEGTVASLTKDQQVMVLMTILGRPQELRFTPDSLEIIA